MSASANTVGGVPDGSDVDAAAAATTDVVVVKLKQPLSTAESKKRRKNDGILFKFLASIYINFI